MRFNVFMSRQEVVEKYGITPELEAEVFAFLQPAFGCGVSARYLESRVDQQLDKYFSNKDRLSNGHAWCFPNKEPGMAQSWADTVANDEEGPHLAVLEPLLVGEKQAAQMLGVSKRKLFDLNKSGVLPSRQVGKRKLYSVKKLREFAEGGGE